METEASRELDEASSGSLSVPPCASDVNFAWRLVCDARITFEITTSSAFDAWRTNTSRGGDTFWIESCFLEIIQGD